MVEGSQSEDGEDADQIDEEGPRQSLQLPVLESLVQGEFIREPTEDPTEGSDDHVGAGQRGGHDDDLLTISER